MDLSSLLAAFTGGANANAGGASDNPLANILPLLSAMNGSNNAGTNANGTNADGQNAANPLASLLPLLSALNGSNNAGTNAGTGGQGDALSSLLPLLSALSGGNPLSSLFSSPPAPEKPLPLPAAPLDPVAEIADGEILYSMENYMKNNPT